MLSDAIDGNSTSRKRPRSPSKNSDSGASSPKRSTSEGPSSISESSKTASRDEIAMKAYGVVPENPAGDGNSIGDAPLESLSAWRKRSGEEKMSIFSSQINQPLKPGASWFIISMKWLNDWKMACGGGISKGGVKEESTLGSVDNSMLVDEAGFFKVGLQDETDYKLVPKQMWDFFVEW